MHRYLLLVVVAVALASCGKGPEGPQGAQGPQGPQGPQGQQGAVGPQGQQGPAGQQGPRGEPGPAGAKGDTGATGLQGTAGPQGPAGPQGLQGPKGDRGEATATIRRLDCAANGCADGCAADEIAISAFCGANTFAAPDGDRNVQCAGVASPARPAMLVCAKK